MCLHVWMDRWMDACMHSMHISKHMHTHKLSSFFLAADTMLCDCHENRCHCETTMQQHQVPTRRTRQNRQKWLLLHPSPKEDNHVWSPQVQGVSSFIILAYMQPSNWSSLRIEGCDSEAREATCWAPTPSICYLLGRTICLWACQKSRVPPLIIWSLVFTLCYSFLGFRSAVNLGFPTACVVLYCRGLRDNKSYLSTCYINK